MLNLELWHIVLTAIVLLFLGGVIGGWIAILGSVIKASKEARQSVSTLLEEAADKMAQSPSQRWAGWGLHLLKALDVRVTGEEFPAALKAIRSSIDVRLDTGRWTEDSPDCVDATFMMDQPVQGLGPGHCM